MNIRHIRSFVCRSKKLGARANQTFEQAWPSVGIDLPEKNQKIDLNSIFKRAVPKILEIGFGSGENLFSLATQYPDLDFLGIEVYKRGIISLLSKLNQRPLSNIKLLFTDAERFLGDHMSDAALDAILILFPDPWPKSRHHKRRLIKNSFVETLARKIKENGLLHLATDCEEYARHMVKVLNDSPYFVNSEEREEIQNSIYHCVVTKYEQRGKRLGQSIFDLVFIRRPIIKETK